MKYTSSDFITYAEMDARNIKLKTNITNEDDVSVNFLGMPRDKWLIVNVKHIRRVARIKARQLRETGDLESLQIAKTILTMSRKRIACCIAVACQKITLDEFNVY